MDTVWTRAAAVYTQTHSYPHTQTLSPSLLPSLSHFFSLFLSLILSLSLSHTHTSLLNTEHNNIVQHNTLITIVESLYWIIHSFTVSHTLVLQVHSNDTVQCHMTDSRGGHMNVRLTYSSSSEKVPPNLE